MTAPLKTVEGTDLAALMKGSAAAPGRRARTGAGVDCKKDAALAAMAAAIRARQADILPPMRRISPRPGSRRDRGFVDRLALDDKRVAAMAEGLDVVPRSPIRSAP